MHFSPLHTLTFTSLVFFLSLRFFLCSSEPLVEPLLDTFPFSQDMSNISIGFWEAKPLHIDFYLFCVKHIYLTMIYIRRTIFVIFEHAVFLAECCLLLAFVIHANIFRIGHHLNQEIIIVNSIKCLKTDDINKRNAERWKKTPEMKKCLSVFGKRKL